MTIRSIILVKIWNVSRAVACTHREILACNSANSVKSARPRRTRTRIDVVFSLNELWRIFWTPALPFSNGAVTGPVRLPIFSSSTMSPVCNMSPVHSSPVELPLRHSIDRTVDLAASVELDRSMVILMVRWVKVRSFVLERESSGVSVWEFSLYYPLSLSISVSIADNSTAGGWLSENTLNIKRENLFSGLEACGAPVFPLPHVFTSMNPCYAHRVWGCCPAKSV